MARCCICEKDKTWDDADSCVVCDSCVEAGKDNAALCKRVEELEVSRNNWQEQCRLISDTCISAIDQVQEQADRRIAAESRLEAAVRALRAWEDWAKQVSAIEVPDGAWTKGLHDALMFTDTALSAAELGQDTPTAESPMREGLRAIIRMERDNLQCDVESLNAALEHKEDDDE